MTVSDETQLIDGVFHVPKEVVEAVQLVAARWSSFTNPQEAIMLRAALLSTIKRTRHSGTGSAKAFNRDLRVLAELIISLTKRR